MSVLYSAEYGFISQKFQLKSPARVYFHTKYVLNDLKPNGFFLGSHFEFF